MFSNDLETAAKSRMVCCLITLLISACGSDSQDEVQEDSQSSQVTMVSSGAASSINRSSGLEYFEAVPMGYPVLPVYFPSPKVLPSNPLTLAKVELGRFLFYDRKLSINQERSCGDCHQPAKAFTDGKALAVGVTGMQIHARNSMSLTNVAYNAGFNWANPNVHNLEQQVHGVLFNETPIELGWSDAEDQILNRLKEDVTYADLFNAAFSDDADPFTVANVERALASFERALISGNSAFDAFEAGNESALSEAAKKGKELFFSEQLECFHCHGGFNFSQAVDHEGIVLDQLDFHNNGLYNIAGTGDYPANNTGLWEFNSEASNMGKFRAPTLRNIALTAPYMHDGSIANLDAVIDHYARGGRLIEEGELAGDGNLSPYKSELLAGFILSDQDKAHLKAFLESLTDWAFICASQLQDPYGNHPMHSRCAELNL
ncbi:methanobactin export MATE transporter MbnM [Marinagarivorans algicola]|uniref:methanobactin export MATE transporter MbnM n=1 Tax=Marinagarivorans algicola TaxID=1513270 RepID=UPI001C0F9E9C|nr:methanobactin export MATE transporter MbnM [Marinagarivorans algicola]